MKALESRWKLVVLVTALAVAASLLILPSLIRGEGVQQSEGAAPSSQPTVAGSNTDALIAGLQRRLQENPKDFASHINLANAYLQKVRENGDPSLYAKAEELLDRAEKLDPRDAELFATRGILALARHDFAGALAWGEKALALNPDTARYYGIVGDAQIELGRYREAVGSYQEMINRRPDFDSFSRVAHARELYGDPDGAVDAMQDAVDAGSAVPENKAWAYVQLGNLRFTTGNLDAAAEDYALSARTLANYPPALAGRARIAAARGELEQAAALYQEAFDRMPLPEYAIALGDVYAKMGDPGEAEEQYELVRAIDSLFRANGVNTDLEVALFYADHGLELQTSLKKARSAYEARPSIHAADVLAWTLYKTGDYEEAERYASESLRLGTRDPLKLFHAGMISRALGQDDRAREHLQQAVDLNPRFSVLHADALADALEELEAAGVRKGDG
ncbi:MAG: tetratricopeptide repeat protein [Rubrobacter sp.]